MLRVGGPDEPKMCNASGDSNVSTDMPATSGMPVVMASSPLGNMRDASSVSATRSPMLLGEGCCVAQRLSMLIVAAVARVSCEDDEGLPQGPQAKKQKCSPYKNAKASMTEK